MKYNNYQNNPMAKLNWYKVRQIRKKWMRGVSQTDLAKEYHVSISAIHRIVSNKYWVKR